MATLTLGANKRTEARIVALETQVHACMLHAVKAGVFRPDDPRLEPGWLRDGLIATIRMQLGELRWWALPGPVRLQIEAIPYHGDAGTKLIELSPACLVAYALGCFVLTSSDELMPDDPAAVEYVMDILRDAHDAATCGHIDPTPAERGILNAVDDLWFKGRGSSDTEAA